MALAYMVKPFSQVAETGIEPVRLYGFDSKKHSGIIAKFREFYLKTDLFDKDFSDSISSL